jgi:predicted AlkP superfamily phosphohydrolase/phosphomutase
VKGREPCGIVDPGDEYEEICSRLTEELLSCRDELSGEPIVEKVLHRRDIYAGPYVDKAPDLLVRWREDIPICGIKIPRHANSMQARAIERASTPFVPGEDYRIISGDHRLNGILFYVNPAKSSKGCHLENASLVDIAPTVLYALGLPVPDVMDGKVITSLFDEAYLHSHPINSIQSGFQAASRRPDEKDYSEEDEEKVKERLRSLGYVE